MDTAEPSRRRHHLSTLSILFTRYLAGQIADSQWAEIMHLLDAQDTTFEERVALAHFINDAYVDAGSGDVQVPRKEEVLEMLEQMRTA